MIDPTKVKTYECIGCTKCFIGGIFDQRNSTNASVRNWVSCRAQSQKKIKARDCKIEVIYFHHKKIARNFLKYRKFYDVGLNGIGLFL
jgi:uncharacterized protein YfcZ (UPF0381/DUF406 family)